MYSLDAFHVIVKHVFDMDMALTYLIIYLTLLKLCPNHLSMKLNLNISHT